LDIHEALAAVDKVCLDIVGDVYDESHYFHVHRVRFAYTLMALSELGAPGRFLEVGSDGLFLRLARDVLGSAEAAGTNHTSDEPYVRVSQDENLWTFYVGDLEAGPLPRESETFDTILCGEVIEHMPRDPMGLLLEINRLLVPGGRCVITTPNVASFRNIKMAIDGGVPMNFYQFRKDGSLDRHHIEYTAGLLSDLVEAAGFEVESLETQDCWALPDENLVAYMQGLGVDLTHRRDNIFLVARKVGGVRERYPDFLYV